jgi:hypothetical protein
MLLGLARCVLMGGPVRFSSLGTIGLDYRR